MGRRVSRTRLRRGGVAGPAPRSGGLTEGWELQQLIREHRKSRGRHDDGQGTPLGGSAPGASGIGGLPLLPPRRLVRRKFLVHNVPCVLRVCSACLISAEPAAITLSSRRSLRCRSPADPASINSQTDRRTLFPWTSAGSRLARAST